jgi:signal transduction histidine kinase/CheY-like chemotaxis protein
MPELRILLLEDNPHDAELTKRELERGGLTFSIDRVVTEDEFREAIRCDYDVVLADYNLPGFTGLAALEIAKELAPAIPFIVVSGSLGEERAIEAVRRGATDYILKDRTSRLPEAVKRALTEREERSLRASAQAELKMSQERFLIAATATQDVIWDRRMDSDRIWVNDAMRSVWGHDTPPEGVTLEWLTQHVHPNDIERVEEAFATALAGRASRLEVDYQFQRFDGTFGHVRNRSMILRDPNGRAVRIIGAMQDLSSLVDAKTLLAQERRISSLGRIAATTAHEFNNVMMAIQSFAEVLAARGKDNPATLKATNHILTAISRGRRITHDILRVVRPGEASREIVDLGAWLRDLTSELRSLLPPGIEVIANQPSESKYACFDPRQIQQVMSNLAVNARDAMGTTGTLTVSMTARDGQVEIAVTDTGGGIAEGILDQIFEPLFTTKKQGTGLGLAVVRQMVTLNGGTIDVRSRPPFGTTFTLAFPEARDFSQDAAPAEKGGSLRGKRLLLVDDDAHIVEAMVMLLRMDGFEVQSVSRAAEVDEAVERLKPDAVILDLNLPDGSGIDVVRRIHSAHRSMPVVIASGENEPDAIRELKKSGVIGFLRKPFDLDALLQELSRLG